MKYLCALVVLVALFLHDSNALQLTFAANVSASYDVNGNVVDWGYRKTNVGLIDLGGLAGSAWFSSISVGGTKYSLEGDAIWGACNVAVGGGMPVCSLAYYSANVTVANASQTLNMDTTTAQSFVATSFVALVEKDANGNVVKTLSMADTLLGLNWKITDHSTGDSNPKYVTFSGSDVIAATYTIDITYSVSDVIGVLPAAQGGGVLSPKSLESIVQINNWPYMNTANTLTLVSAFATGAASHTVDRRYFVSGSGNTQAYFSVAGNAVINGQTQSVTVSAFADGQIDQHFANANIKEQIVNKYGSNWVVKVCNVTFPAGAESILYDPSAGAGAPVQPSNAMFVAANLFVVVVMALVVLL